MSPPALTLDRVTRRYRAGLAGCSAQVTALDAVSLIVAAGECVGVAGGAGAGKTTLLLCAAGLLPPDSGTVHAARAAYVPPFGAAHPSLGVRASLEYAATLRELDGCDDAPDVDGVMARTGLTRVASRRIGQLTGEARARAALAHALLGEPRLLCLDDPLAALDAVSRARYGALLADLCAGGTAILIAARDARVLEPPAARVVTLDAGRLATPARRSRTLELRVGMPRHAATALSGHIPSVRRRGRALRVPLERISAEEVLSACLALGIDVHGSRVITTPVRRVAEGHD